MSNAMLLPIVAGASALQTSNNTTGESGKRQGISSFLTPYQGSAASHRWQNLLRGLPWHTPKLAANVDLTLLMDGDAQVMGPDSCIGRMAFSLAMISLMMVYHRRERQMEWHDGDKAAASHYRHVTRRIN